MFICVFFTYEFLGIQRCTHKVPDILNSTKQPLQSYSSIIFLFSSISSLKVSSLIAFSFFSSFFCQLYPGLRNCKSVFLILKIFQYGGLRWYPCKNWYKNWYLHFCKTYDHQFWQVGTSTRLGSNGANQAGAGDVITSRSHDKLKTYLSYQSTYGDQIFQDGNLLWWNPAHKFTWRFDQGL